VSAEVHEWPMRRSKLLSIVSSWAWANAFRPSLRRYPAIAVLPGLACHRRSKGAPCGMRLFQDQVYQKGEQFIRIVRLDRYEVEYKTTTGSVKSEGTQTILAKKPFCRLLKGMILVVPEKKEPLE